LEPDSIRKLLENLTSGQVSIDQAMEQLKNLPYEELDGMAHLDHHRALRTGHPEVIFGQGKTADQVAAIFTRLQAVNPSVMATRVSAQMYAEIKDRLPGTEYSPQARILYSRSTSLEEQRDGVLILTAGTADIPVAEEAALTAELLGNKVERIFDVGVSGLHRLLDRLPRIQQAKVIIVVAGMEGALPSVVGGLTSAPVVAVPTSIGYGASFNGLAALLAMLNSCAAGVAVVNIDNGFGAACLADKILRVGGK
jgi:NCAIR mutase (PurE)-related protein